MDEKKLMNSNNDVPQLNVHIINHTHWDREWFLTQEYTTEWLPALVDSLGDLVAANSNYQYLLDGQTLAVEDLLKLDDSYRSTVTKLISSGSLGMGPLYSQPDWRMTGGETLLRNLLYGTDDLASHGGSTDVAWLVDTFGHISQTPQLLSMFGIDSAYVWRGAPQLEPLFTWNGADDTKIATVNLFGGYRNLYGITRTKDLAVQRLDVEANKLAPYYGSLPIPLFDGYDLETEPEDPVSFYRSIDEGLPDGIEISESSPRDYLDAISAFLHDAPTIKGELLSGKYGATFPGSLSSRIHLKVLQDECERLLFNRVEPLAVLAHSNGRTYETEQYEQWGRELLQDAVHDCICGVSIDQVHERMERSYRQMFDAMNTDIAKSLSHTLSTFAPGQYAVSTNVMEATGIVRHDGQALLITTNGIGITPVVERTPVDSTETPADGFQWMNDHYRAVLNPDGTIGVDDGTIGRFVLRQDAGDTYSAEIGEVLAEVTPCEAPVIESRSELDTVVRYKVDATWASGSIEATVRATFDDSAVIKLSIDLDSTGVGFNLDMVFETSLVGQIHAGMPFDDTVRSAEDTNLLPTVLEPELTRVLMGQREVDSVTAFPFHGYVAIEGPTSTASVLARGLRSYQADAQGAIKITLRRSCEWLALSGLELRSGDAGPAMYVPDARCERTVRHELAFRVGKDESSIDGVINANQQFQNPPLVVSVDEASTGTRTAWQVASGVLPSTAFHLVGTKRLLRLYNPTDQIVRLEKPLPSLNVRGGEVETLTEVKPKQIVTTIVDNDLSAADNATPAEQVAVWQPPQIRVGPNRSVPDPKILADLASRSESYRNDLVEIETELSELEGEAWHLANHRKLVVARELAETDLSIELNRRKLATEPDQCSLPDNVDPAIRALGEELNNLRIERRIYDYVAEMLTFECE